MKVLFSFVMAINALTLFAQKIEVPAETKPYYQVLEWKGSGLIALSRDPGLVQRQIRLTMVDDSGKTKFTQNLNPLQDKLHFLAEDGSKYCYFLEDLEPREGKVFLHQLNLSGNIKVEKVDLIGAVKKIGKFVSDDLKIMDIVCTDKALVWMIRVENNELKKTQTIAVSMTHHNFLTFPFVVSEHPIGSNKTEDQISFYVAGEKGENIVFAARSFVSKSSGWFIKEFSPKGVLSNELSLDNLSLKFEQHQRIGFGRRGMSLLDLKEPNESGTLVVVNGEFFVGGIESTGSSAVFSTYKWEEKQWKSVQKTNLAQFSMKKNNEVGFMIMKEGLVWYVKNTLIEGHFHGIDKTSKAVVKNIDKSSYNPSRILTEEFVGKMVTPLNGKWLCFDPSQLPGVKSLQFELN
jgi:hypothetical protein